MRGVSDLILIHPKDGRFIGCEVKSETGIQSEHQKTFEEKVLANKGIYLLVRSVEELQKGLREAGVVIDTGE